MSEQLFKKNDFITLAELRAKLAEDANYGVYIINAARIPVNSSEYDELGIESPIAEDKIDAAININIGTVKEPMLVNIAPTWIPINLADYGEPVEIFKSQGFKSMVERGYIALINKEGYERVMEDEGAQEARQYMLNQKYATSSQSNDQLLDHLNKNASTRTAKKAERFEKSSKKASKATLSAAAHEFTDKSTDTPHTTLFQKYKALEPKLSVVDLDHISKHTVIPKIKAAAEKKLATMQ